MSHLNLVHTKCVRLRQMLRMGSMATCDFVHIYWWHFQEWDVKDQRIMQTQMLPVNGPLLPQNGFTVPNNVDLWI